MTKPTIRALRVGQKVWATVEENLSSDQIIASFEGDLIRLINHSDKTMNVGARVQMIVTSTLPLEFRLIPQDSDSRHTLRYHVEI